MDKDTLLKAAAERIKKHTTPKVELKVISTGHPELDQLIGGPDDWEGAKYSGFPCGRITILEGPDALTAADNWASHPSLIFQKLHRGSHVKLTRQVPHLLRSLANEQKALVITSDLQKLPKVLMFYSYLRLRFSEGRVSVTKSKISPMQGHSITWPTPTRQDQPS